MFLLLAPSSLVIRATLILKQSNAWDIYIECQQVLDISSSCQILPLNMSGIQNALLSWSNKMVIRKVTSGKADVNYYLE